MSLVKLNLDVNESVVQVADDNLSREDLVKYLPGLCAPH